MHYGKKTDVGTDRFVKGCVNSWNGWNFVCLRSFSWRDVFCFFLLGRFSLTELSREIEARKVYANNRSRDADAVPLRKRGLSREDAEGRTVSRNEGRFQGGVLRATVRWEYPKLRFGRMLRYVELQKGSHPLILPLRNSGYIVYFLSFLNVWLWRVFGH